MKKYAGVLYSFGLSAAILTAVATATLGTAAAAEEYPMVSPALSVIAEENGMAMAGLIGNSISFDREDFARALNLSKVSSIIITEAPAVSAGELRVGDTVVSSGQKLGASSLSLLTYTASSLNSTRAVFRFKTEGCGYDIPCTLYLLDKINHAPTLESVPETTLNVSTHRNISLYGSLPCYDPNGDKTIVEIVAYPKNGLLTLTDRYSGEYVYSPASNYSGKDSFTYVARDIYGNYSAAATVSLNINKPKTTASFDDMKSSPYYNAALTMAEEGIMSGTQVGSNTYFYPDGAVSRGEFVVMLLHAVGMDDVTAVSKTVFADDADIPEYMKDYIATAYELGYIRGVQTENGLCFEATRSITRAEAAVMLGNVLDVSVPTVLPTFSDSSSIPTWAAPSVYSLNSIGVLTATEGNIAATSVLTRGDAAQILANLMSYLD